MQTHSRSRQSIASSLVAITMAVSLTLVPALASAWEAKALTTGSAVAMAPEPAANGSDLQGGTPVSRDAFAGQPSEAQHPDEHINA